MRILTTAMIGLLGAILLEPASAQVSLEIRQDATLYNLASTNGRPLSTIVGTPPGSDGRAPTLAQQQEAGLTEVPPTGKQFQGMVSFGGVTKWKTNAFNPALSYYTNATNLNMALGAVAGDERVKVLILPHARLNSPFLSRTFSYQFGDAVPVPDVDEFGVLLSMDNDAHDRPVQRPEDYWFAEPYSANNHTNADYYYSPHRREVFAVNPGPMSIVWRRAVPSEAPATNNVGVVSISGVNYVVVTNRYMVSSSPAKTPRRMYWTEKTFVDTGKPIAVPSAQLGEIKIVYTKNFPKYETNEVVIPGVVPIVTTNALKELRTLWYDDTAGGQIRAYNREGRVLVELLGDLRADGYRQHLGYEIVDVIRQPAPVDITVELGDKLTAGTTNDAALFPELLFQVGQSFTFQHAAPGSSKLSYYASRETINQNDLQVHWLEEGEQGLKWPLRFVRYKLVWPGDVSRYSHYVRPLVETENEAKATAVPLPSQNAPVIAYQDPLDQPRGKLTESFAYYSFLDRAHPAHRALLRFTSGEFVRFERVFSWLDLGLRDANIGFGADFAAPGKGGTAYGDATVAGGILHLTDAAGLQTNSFLLGEFNGTDPVNSFRATFNVSLRGTPLSGGFSFNFGELPVEGAFDSGEDGTSNGLAVGFDTQNDGGNDDGPGIEIKLDGVRKGFAKMPLVTGDEFVPVVVELHDGGRMEVSFNGVPAFVNGIATGYTPRIGRFGFAARTSDVRPPNVRLPNAWKIADVSTTPGGLLYLNALTLVQKQNSTNQGWRLSVDSRLTERSGNGAVAQFMGYGHGDRRFMIGFDATASGELTAQLFGAGGTTLKLTAAGQATADYHRHELVYNPATTSATYFFDGARLFTWTGAIDANYNRQAFWGAASGTGKGTVNYHRVEFAINGQVVSEYSAGLDGSPTLAPDPTSLGWIASAQPTPNVVTNAPVSPDTANAPGVDFFRQAVLAESALVGFYPVDGDTGSTLTDRRFPAQNGTLTNTAIIVTGPGAVGTHFLQGSQVNLGIVPEYQFSNGVGTVEAWLYQTNTGFNACFFSCRSATQTRYSLHGDAFGTNIHVWNGANVVRFPTPANMFNRGVHVAVVFNGGTVTVYFDGVSLGTRVLPLGVAGLSCQIGGSLGVPAEAWLGRIDELAVYTNALSAATIAAHAALLDPTLVPAPTSHWIDDLSIVVNKHELPADGVSFAGSVATQLDSWRGDNLFAWLDLAARPRVVNAPAIVGRNITAPDGEIGGGLDPDYLAGYILQSKGTLFHNLAYVDPFVAGFAAANRGAIIPVNAIPGENQLEVWWFRDNRLDPVDLGQGFRDIRWPSVIGRYTLEWPEDAREIILASDDGSGALESLQAKGSIYVQNNRSLPGYNPNEEHALMQGGQVFALRDDLNITTSTNGEYSSEPFVLLSYAAADGRPAIRPFKVRRENPEAGITFDFQREAGTILQPPMPLPLMEKPLAPNIAGQPPKNLNTEIAGYRVPSSRRAPAGSVTNHVVTTADRHFIKPFDPVALQDANNPAAPWWLFPTDVGVSSLTGLVSSVPPVTMKSWGGAQNANSRRWRFAASIPTNLVAGSASALLFTVRDGTNAGRWTVTVTEVNRTNRYVEVQFPSDTPATARTDTTLVMAVAGPVDDAFKGYRLAPEPLPIAIADATLRERFASFTLQDRKGTTWFYRGPHDPAESPSLVMKFYYKTLPTFFFPTLALEGQPQPPVGTVTPYLRPKNPDGSFAGDPVYGNKAEPQFGDNNPLGITYRPVWPENVGVLQMAETLTTPRRGLPAVRGQTSLEIVYQQSQIAGGTNHESAVLHDPTREKSYALGAPGNGSRLDGIPDSAKTQSYQGRTYFPDLPPHLVERFFLDPNRGAFGELVFKGEFVDAALGDAYLFLNVVGQSDARELKALCVTGDPRETAWRNAIDGLSTTNETYIENPAKPRTYIPSAPEHVGAGQIARVGNDDVAVDSYALSATGPGTGYVSLIAGNGRAFTPEGDPVSVKILKVVKTLYRGEVNIVESSNPLNEQLTLQQVVDLAGKTEDYNFQWKIASPVDGLPPAVYRNTRRELLTDGVWSHLRYPLETDTAASVRATDENRRFQDVTTTVAPVSRVVPTSVTFEDGKFHFVAPDHGLVSGNHVVLRKTDGAEVFGTVHGLTTASDIFVTVDPNQLVSVTTEEFGELCERVVPSGIQSIVFREFTEPAGNYSQYWLSLNLDDALGAVVYIDGQLAVRANTGQDDSATIVPPGTLDPLSRAYLLNPATLAGGTLNADGSRTHVVAVELISGARRDAFIDFNVRLEAFTFDDVTDAGWVALEDERYLDGVRLVLGGSPDIRTLADNYIIMCYQPKNRDHASYESDGGSSNRVWSQWTTPQLAEGWIKRVLKGINPFNQRITDLFNNSVDTKVSIVAQAGQRWEGDVALNLEAINSAGLIEIYETVLRRGKGLSIGGGINYGPANDALLLAAGYLNDLYMVLGNEAWADASNPTIGIGTRDNTYGSIATALFAFRGQLPSLLEEELALMRGRDDFLLPGVETRPVYNRMVWNYTRGIDAGEVVYALNYNVLDQNADGKVDADDARQLYPQGHGDAYGHYLTALKGYYALLMDENFDWVPRIEAVTVLGKPVSVDYQDERKFAGAAAAVARAGKHTFDLTWRRDYKSGTGNGWSHFSTNRVNSTTRNLTTTRNWGMDHWASRTGQGAYLNWVVGNSILPPTDPDPSHYGSIQQVDRTTVPELKELVIVERSLQTALDNAEAGLTPLGLPDATIPFDLNPLSMANGPFTHFEQIFQRAKDALNNAVVSFDDAKDVTRAMRSEEDSLAEFRATVNQQELAYTNTLIELYGTPYPEDIGPGKPYRTGYAGPDTLHYAYIDNVELTFGTLLTPESDVTWNIDTQTFESGWANSDLLSTFNFIMPARDGEIDGLPATEEYLASTNRYISYNLSSHGFFKKPRHWTGRRASPGKIQQAISDIVKARNAAYDAFYWADAAKYDLDWAIASLAEKRESFGEIRDKKEGILAAQQVVDTAKLASDVVAAIMAVFSSDVIDFADAMENSIPRSFIAGLSTGGDLTAPLRGSIKFAAQNLASILKIGGVAAYSAQRSLEYATETANRYVEFKEIAPEEFNQELREAVSEVRDKVYGMNNFMMTINARLQELDDARRAYRSLLAEGDRIQMERQVFRQRAAAVIQGFRTRDAGFRIFRNEKLERYKSLYELAARYAFMAAQAYDYDTGLLHTDQGREFINRIIRSRALGVVQNGNPQFAGSNTGDPGLSSVLAEMYGDWSVIKSRLGFNNPDAYGTTVSLRTENFRILPTAYTNLNDIGVHDAAWKDILNAARTANVLEDPDVRRYCMQIDPGNGLPVPGLIVEFSTTIADGLNLFGRPLAAWDHAFSPSSFATKIFAVGVAFEGYPGMDDPDTNEDAIVGGGGESPGDPNLAFLDPNAMSATPYIYLIPVGLDSMRSPPLGDQSVVRTWSVQDVTIPLPFNIGGSDFSSKQLWQSDDSLTEPLFNIRKHQAFRPVSTASVWAENSIYSTGGELWHNKYTNTRLIGRSVWNSKWKIVIPGRTLLNNPDEGLERFIRSVNDIKLYFHTYSYSGN